LNNLVKLVQLLGDAVS